MKTPNRRQGHKEFQRPKLQCHGRIEQIAVPSYNPSRRPAGRGGACGGTARDISGD